MRERLEKRKEKKKREEREMGKRKEGEKGGWSASLLRVLLSCAGITRPLSRACPSPRAVPPTHSLDPPAATLGNSTQPFQALLTCLDAMDSEAFCQNQLLLMANCKFERVRGWGARSGKARVRQGAGRDTRAGDQTWCQSGRRHPQCTLSLALIAASPSSRPHIVASDRGLAMRPRIAASQDNTIRSRVLDWWKTRARTATEAERAKWQAELEADMQNTRARLKVAGPFDPSKVKFRTQLQGEVADLAAWQAALHGDDPPHER